MCLSYRAFIFLSRRAAELAEITHCFRFYFPQRHRVHWEFQVSRARAHRLRCFALRNRGHRAIRTALQSTLLKYCPEALCELLCVARNEPKPVSSKFAAWMCSLCLCGRPNPTKCNPPRLCVIMKKTLPQKQPQTYGRMTSNIRKIDFILPYVFCLYNRLPPPC